MSYRDLAESNVVCALRDARAETLRSILRALETGALITEVMDGVAPLSGDWDKLRERLRVIRDDLVELDQYRLLYGELEQPASTPLKQTGWWGVDRRTETGQSLELINCRFNDCGAIETAVQP